MRASILVMTAALAAASACARDERTAPQPDDPIRRDYEVTVIDREAAAASIAEAQCQRAERCNEIGEQGVWSDRGICFEDWRGTTARDLEANDCPGEIASSNLDECLRAVEADQCGVAKDVTDVDTFCSPQNVCQTRLISMNEERP